jgi:hypothetical protein
VPVVNNVGSVSLVGCTFTCLLNNVCDIVNYHSSDESCQLLTLSDPLTASYTNLVNDENWEFWCPEYINLV